MKKETISSLQDQTDEELLNLLNEKIEDKSFANIVKYQLKLAEKQSSKNKNTYFWLCEAIIILTGATSIVNAFVTEGANIIIKFLCVIFPVITTILLSIKNERKYDETWKRHVNRYVALQLETSYYVYNLTCSCRANTSYNRNITPGKRKFYSSYA